MHFVHFEMEICLKTRKILFTFPKERGSKMIPFISCVSSVQTRTVSLHVRVDQMFKFPYMNIIMLFGTLPSLNESYELNKEIPMIV